MTPDPQHPWPVAPAGGETRVLRPHAHLFHAGDEATHFFEILQGSVRSCKLFADGRRQIVAFGFAGDIVGFGHGETYRFDCDALAETRVRAIARNELMRAVRARPELGITSHLTPVGEAVGAAAG